MKTLLKEAGLKLGKLRLMEKDGKIGALLEVVNRWLIFWKNDQRLTQKKLYIYEFLFSLIYDRQDSKKY